jgi:hypothetical protein
MTRLPEVFARVLVRTGIAAADVAAGKAHSQVRPRVLTVLGALLAPAGRQRFRIDDVGGKVFARCGHRCGAVALA